MSTPSITTDSTLLSNAAPILAGGAAEAVNDKIANAGALAVAPGSHALAAGSERNLGLENSVKNADALLNANEKGMPAAERDKMIQALIGSLSRTNPGMNASPKVAEEAAETMRRLVKAVMKAMKSLFGKGGAENSGDEKEPIWMIGRSGGSSGYGMMHDQLKELLERKGDEFDSAHKAAEKGQQAKLDMDNLDTPGMGAMGGPGRKG